MDDTEKVDYNITDDTLTLEEVYRSAIGEELTVSQWYAVAFHIKGAVEVAVEEAVGYALDNMAEILMEYEDAAEQEWDEEWGDS